MEPKAWKRGRTGLLRTRVDYPTSPFKEEVMGSNPIRATEFIRELAGIHRRVEPRRAWASTSSLLGMRTAQPSRWTNPLCGLR